MHPSSEEKEEEEDCLTEKSKSLTENSPAATLNSAEFSRASGNLIWQSDFLPSRVQTVFLPLSLSLGRLLAWQLGLFRIHAQALCTHARLGLERAKLGVESTLSAAKSRHLPPPPLIQSVGE